jgi:hypothetical protein
VPVWGVEGSALSTLVAYRLLHTLVVRFARRIRHLRRPPLRRALSCAAVAAAAVAVPSHGVFAVARVAATLVSLGVFGVVLQRLISPGRETRLSRAVGWANARR